MSTQKLPSEKIDSELKEAAARKEQARKDQEPVISNNDSDVAPEKDQNDVLSGHE
jgi:hypothetical protein